MEEWGIPDWRDAAAYGNSDQWDLTRWRWEFIRRRTDVREAFDKYCWQTYESDLRYNERDDIRPYRPDEAGFTAGCYLAFQLGYHGLPNPRISAQTEFAISSVKGEDGGLAGHGGEIGDPNFLQINFDLSKPIRKQLEVAEEWLRTRQIDVVGKHVQRRRHTDKYLTYLRVLDGREAGASWAELSEILTHTARTEQTARDTWEQARDLCFNF